MRDPTQPNQWSWVGSALAVALCAAGPAPSRAQEDMKEPPAAQPAVDDGIDISNYSPGISKEEVDLYLKILGATDDQKAVTTALYEGMLAEYRGVAKTHAREGKKIQLLSMGAWDEASGKRWERIQKEHDREAQRLEHQFMDDFKAVFAGEHADRWPEVERRRARDRTLGNGCFAGETVDLGALVESTEMAAELKESLKPGLAQWEAELDSALKARDRARQAFDRTFEWNWDEEAMERASVQFEPVRRAGLKVAEITKRHVHLLISQLPEEEGAKLRDAFEKSAYSGVYWESYADHVFAAAEKFEDLTEDQKERVAGIKVVYLRQLKSFQQRARAALEASQATAPPQYLFWGWQTETMQRLWTERTESDKRFIRQVHQTLTEGQMLRLPTP